jgi:hypothetical protein
LLGCRSGVGKLSRPLCCRKSRACFVVALAAATGSVKMLAHLLPLAAAAGVLADERFEDVQNLLLLTAGHLGDRFKELPGATARGNDPLGAWLAQQFLDGDAEGFGHRVAFVGETVLAQCSRRVCGLAPTKPHRVGANGQIETRWGSEGLRLCILSQNPCS